MKKFGLPKACAMEDYHAHGSIWMSWAGDPVEIFISHMFKDINYSHHMHSD